MEIQAGDYKILIEPGLHLKARAVLGHLDLGKVAIISNKTVAPLYAEPLVRAFDGHLIAVEDGERYKTLKTAEHIYGALVEAGLDRSSTVIALGGGVVGDLAGFVAATYMRGIRLIQMPTTLLSMVDSSVGGKVGVDLPFGKNLVGAFKQPAAVLIDPKALDTLPEKEWRCGLAEVIKHGLLQDEALLSPLLHVRGRATELITKAVKVKVRVVLADPFEQGERQHLNLGHTFAHAIERVSSYAWPHGEAVAVGLLAAARLSERIGLAKAHTFRELEPLLKNAGLPTSISLSPRTLVDAMATDKKWRDTNRFVLLKQQGQPKIVENIPKGHIIEVLKALTKSGASAMTPAVSTVSVSSATGALIDGKAIAKKVRGEVRDKVSALESKIGTTPHLVVVLASDDPASAIYVKSKGKAAAEANIRSTQHTLPSTTPKAELLELIQKLNANDDVDGILVQLPLPDQHDELEVINSIAPEKDVDGLHPINAGRLARGDESGLIPCTPLGCIRLLEESGVDIKGKHAVVLGRSRLVGRPVADLLLNRHATVTICHSRTKDLSDVIKSADILIAAVGRESFVKGSQIKFGATVIDVGINRNAKGKLVGDVSFLPAKEHARAITPVPGGVGPMTIAYLLNNTLTAAARRRGGSS